MIELINKLNARIDYLESLDEKYKTERSDNYLFSAKQELHNLYMLQEAKKQTAQLTHISDSLIIIASHLITTQVSSSIVLSKDEGTIVEQTE